MLFSDGKFTMLEVLHDHHERMRRCLSIHRELCAEAEPQSGCLALSRLRITGANADRSRFIAREILPVLQLRAHPDIDRIIDQLSSDLTGRQEAAKAHIGRWSLEAIEQDWAGYKAASARAMASIEERITLEADCLRPVLG